MRFENKRVAVTGGAGNLGQAVARAFLAEGATVVLIDRVQATIEGAEPGRVSSHLVDLTDAAATLAAFDGIGALDVLCNVAGGFDMGTPVHELSADQWEFMFDINSRTAINASRAALPKMIDKPDGGAIVNVSAKAALAGGATMAPYASSKSVVMRLTESMSAELKSKGINVNCVLPTALDTPQNREAMPNADPSKWVAPADLAAVILFLASSDAKAVHGAAVPVTGLS